MLNILNLVNGPFCEGCVQRAYGERYVESDGLGTSGIMIVGEAPHTDELREGKPFVGASGAFLDRCLRRLGMERSQLFITNSVFCKVRRLGWFDKPDADAVAAFEHCRPHLDRLIERVKPKVIVTLGTTALKRVLGVGGLQERHGYVCDSPYGIPVVPSFHPSFIMQGQQKFTSVLMFALRRAQEVAVKGHSPMPVCYGLDDYAFMADYLDRSGFPLIAADIETPKSSKLDEETLEEEDDSYTIIRASLSHTPGTAVSFPWIEPFIGLFKRAIAKAETVIFHNQGFDVPRLRAAGVGFSGAIHDSMWCLAGKTRVHIYGKPEAKALTIKQIVEGRLDVPLQGMDEFGNIIGVRIIGYHKKVVKAQKWMNIRTGGSRYPILCTPDHKIWTRRDWVEARDIKVGDLIPLPRKGSDDLIHGTVLGDAYVAKDNSLNLLHSEVQLTWLKHKHNHLGRTNLVFTPPSGKGVNRNVQSCGRIDRRWRRLFYPSGVKVFVPPPSDKALAVWYCDDGNWHRNHLNQLGAPRICVAGFSKECQGRMVAWALERFGDRCHISKGGLLVWGGEARERFFMAVAPYIPPCMDYKLPAVFRGRYTGWLESSLPQWAIVESVREYRGRGDKSVRYCVTVDHPTHRFFTEGGLVSNCWHFLQSDLPKGLGFVAPFYVDFSPWKHLSEGQPAFYSATDADATLRCYLGIKSELIKQRRWERWLRHCVQVTPILERMGGKGILVHRGRQDALKARLEAEYRVAYARLQTEVPPEVLPVKRYKTGKQGGQPVDIPCPLCSKEVVI